MNIIKTGIEMERRTTDKEGVAILVELLIRKGVRQAVVSPGSRNAPLLLAFAREERIRHWVVLDERSAAFMALGMAQQSGRPVALVCTSGTAPLNYAPAVAEAYYQRLPLVVITADRPVAWIDQEDSQTIRQYEVFRNIVKASCQLPGELSGEEDRWYANRMVNDLLNTALSGRVGPVHINLPLREPLYGQRPWVACEPRTIGRVEPEPALSPEAMRRLAADFGRSRRVMVLAGFHRPDAALKEALRRLAELPQAVVLAETLSNIASERHIVTIDRVLATLEEGERDRFCPDLLITFGGSLVSKQVKVFLRRYRPRWHWSIDRSEHPADTMQGLTTHILADPGLFFSALVPQVGAVDSDYARIWQAKRRLAEERHAAFGKSVGWSDWKAFSLLLPSLPSGSFLQLSNSTPVRYAQLFDCARPARSDGNRGTSGIEGATSTAIGAALMQERTTTLITGDMGFLYDSNALWNRYFPARLKVVVMKNGGGGIFRFIPGPAELDELEECFETACEVDVEGFARLHRFRYFKAADEEGLRRLLPEFWCEAERPAILEVETPRLENAEVLRSYFRCLRGE